MASFELAGSIKEAIFSSMHAGTAEPFRVTPPEAVVYQDSINFIKNIDSEESSVNFSRSSIALTSGSMLFVFFSCYSLVALIRNKKFSKKTNDVMLKIFFIISFISIISPYPVSYYLEKIALENGYEYSGKLSQSWLYDKNYVYIK